MKKALILAAVLFMAAGCSTKPSDEEKFLNHFKGYSTIEAAPGESGIGVWDITEGGKRLTLRGSGLSYIFVRAESEKSAIYLLSSSLEYPLVFTSATELTFVSGKRVLKK